MPAKNKQGRSGSLLVPKTLQPPSGYKPGTGHQGHQKSFTSSRTAHHRSKKIKTTYRIKIDDKPLTPEQVLDPSSWYAYDHELIA